MRCTLRVLRDLWQDRRGASTIEYGLILGMVAIAIIVSVTKLGTVTGAIWDGVATNVIQHGP